MSRLCLCTSTALALKKRQGRPQAIGRSKGGLSTKIHATYDAPTHFHLTAGQAHDLEGADALLDCVLARLRAADCEVVIPTKIQ